MNMRSRVRQSLWEMKVAFTKNRSFRWTAVVLILMLIADVLPVSAVSTPFNPIHGSDLQATSTLTFTSEADAQVEENNPDTNAGTSSALDVTNANNRSLESYIRFTVSGTSGTVQSALLRVYSTTDSTRNGPAVYATGSTWTETGITWNNRPAHKWRGRQQRFDLKRHLGGIQCHCTGHWQWNLQFCAGRRQQRQRHILLT